MKIVVIGGTGLIGKNVVQENLITSSSLPYTIVRATQFFEFVGSIDELARRVLRAKGDTREIVTDPAAGYFGAKVDDHSLTAGEGAQIGTLRFDEWLKSSVQA